MRGSCERKYSSVSMGQNVGGDDDDDDDDDDDGLNWTHTHKHKSHNLGEL